MRLLFALLLLISFTCFGQVTIRENNIVEKVVQKPKPYDSLMNLSYQKRLVDFKRFVGQKLYYIPKSKKYQYKKEHPDTLIEDFFAKRTALVDKKTKFDTNSKEYKKKSKEPNFDKDSTNIYAPYYLHDKYQDGRLTYSSFVTKENAVEGKYFTILDIVSKLPRSEGFEGKFSKDWKLDHEKYLTSEKSDLKLEDQDRESYFLMVKLKNDVTKDTLMWIVRRPYYIESGPFILVSYFTKLKKKYTSQNLIAMQSLEGLADINTGNRVNIKKNEKWYCTDFSFTDVKTEPQLIPYFYLKNTKGDEIKLSIKDLEDEKFITETYYNALVARRDQEESERKKQEIARQAKMAKDEEESRKTLVKMFGEKYGNLVNDSKVVLGMTKEMCEMSWGSPIAVNTIKSKGSVVEQWVYSGANFLYFKGNVLITIQN
ncbi:MAG: hypothetical protein ACN6OB_17935 [Chryseobacterium jejuense]|uniref:hypothetical protein n=1 Tax=Chryseobacterium jejuense TaxID=445960 RepID=UPI003D0A613A